MTISFPSSARVRAARFLATLALPLLMLSCEAPKSIEVSIDRAVLTDSIVGKPAMDIFPDNKSARELELFTAKHLNHSAEMRFGDVVLARAVLRTPIGVGHFQVSVLSEHIGGTLNESNAAEIARKLSSGSAKVQMRVAD